MGRIASPIRISGTSVLPISKRTLSSECWLPGDERSIVSGWRTSVHVQEEPFHVRANRPKFPHGNARRFLLADWIIRIIFRACGD